MAKNEEMKTEFEVFKDVWNVYKKFYFVTDNNGQHRAKPIHGLVRGCRNR